MKYYFVYIMASRKYGSIYIGLTSDLLKRVYQHKSGYVPGFSKRYKTELLVYYEVHLDVNIAIQSEKRMKKWKRDWKIELIEKQNPDWKDLYGELLKS